MNKFSDQQIVDSWKVNVEPWVSAVRNGEIKSRLLVSNKAIIDAVMKIEPSSVLDVGCGEGWLVRELESCGVSCLGVDVVPELINYALNEYCGRFKTIPYEKLSYDELKEKFDVVVCNFSLLGKESVNNLFSKIPLLLNNDGVLIVQTIHPVMGCGETDYIDGWREGSWDGFSDEFINPAPWYFRTMESWETLFLSNGFNINEVLEPTNINSKIPVSALFIGVKVANKNIKSSKDGSL